MATACRMHLASSGCVLILNGWSQVFCTDAFKTPLLGVLLVKHAHRLFLLLIQNNAIYSVAKEPTLQISRHRLSRI